MMADDKRFLDVQFSEVQEYEDALNDYAPEGALKPDRIGHIEVYSDNRYFPIIATFELASPDDIGYTRLHGNDPAADDAAPPTT